jgi:uncharacterized protein YndB with AHSA1/START domain
MIIFEFQESNEKTILINRTEYPTSDELDKVTEMGVVEGFTGTWDRLEEYLALIQHQQ